MVLIMILILTTTTSVLTRFRPLAGIMVLIEIDVPWGHYVIRNCFRPLAGIMVLIENREESVDVESKKVSVPLRGLWFLSVIYQIQVNNDLGVSVPLRGLWFLSKRKILRS